MEGYLENDDNYVIVIFTTMFICTPVLWVEYKQV